LPVGKKHIHWGFEDPDVVEGDGKLRAFPQVRDAIRQRLLAWR
jgi:protein-tyrosine-phosphatase